jgi:chromosome segregation ATPase
MCVLPEVPSASPSDTQRLISWLEEQRQADHDRLVELARSVEQLRDEVRDHGMTLGHLAETETNRAADGQGEAIDQLEEHVARIERALEEHFEAAARAEQIQAGQRERDIRQLVEFAQQLSALSRASDASQGRLGALAEEVRRVREERAMVLQTLDGLQRGLETVQNRLAVGDEVARRHGNFQSAAEQAIERLRSEGGRLDSQVKLLELRLTRELTDIRRSTDEVVARTEERLRPVSELARQVSGLIEQKDLHDQRIAGLLRDVEAVSVEIGHLDSQSKADRASVKRVAEQIETQNQRIEQGEVLAWQLGERLSSLVAGIEDVKAGLAAAAQHIDDVDRRITRLDGECQRLDENLAELRAALRADQRDSRDHSGGVRAYVESQLADLRAQISDAHHLTIVHLRRTVEELQQQLRELEAGRA